MKEQKIIPIIENSGKFPSFFALENLDKTDINRLLTYYNLFFTSDENIKKLMKEELKNYSKRNRI